MNRASDAAQSGAAGRTPATRGRTPDRQTLLRVAAELFARKGYRATTMQDLADELRIAKPTLYVHGQSKASILEGVIDALLDRAETALTEALKDRDDPQWLRRLLTAWLESSIQLRPHQYAYDTYRNELPATVNQRYRRWERSAAARIRLAVAENQSAGTLRSDVDSEMVTFTVLSLTNWASRWFRDIGPLSVEDVIDRYWQVLWSGLAPEGAAPDGASGRPAGGDREIQEDVSRTG